MKPERDILAVCGRSKLPPPPTCAGTDRKHRDKPMELIGREDDGTYIWRCPRCLCVWRERADA